MHSNNIVFFVLIDRMIHITEDLFGLMDIEEDLRGIKSISPNPFGERINQTRVLNLQFRF